MKYIETESTNPNYNLAFEEYVLEHRTDDDYLMLWQNDNSIIIGRNQNTYAEINSDAVAKYHVNVVRRGTGGGAVYHDLGNLNYSFITREENSEKIAFEKFVHPIVMALRKLGLNAETSGRNDIMIDGCKVSGVAQRYFNGRVLHHGTLLYNENLDMANEVLHVDPDKIKAKGVKSVRSRIGNIRELLMKLYEGDEYSEDVSDFWEYLKDELMTGGASSVGGIENSMGVKINEDTSGMKVDHLTADELAEVEKLKLEKYDTWEWNYGRSLEADIIRKAHFPQGWVEARIKLDHGRIEDIRFYGDFMTPKDLTGLEKQLIGKEYREAEIDSLLETISK